jgi:hypothetical protein
MPRRPPYPPPPLVLSGHAASLTLHPLPGGAMPRRLARRPPLPPKLARPPAARVGRGGGGGGCSALRQARFCIVSVKPRTRAARRAASGTHNSLSRTQAPTPRLLATAPPRPFRAGGGAASRVASRVCRGEARHAGHESASSWPCRRSSFPSIAASCACPISSGRSCAPRPARSGPARAPRRLRGARRAALGAERPARGAGR